MSFNTFHYTLVNGLHFIISIMVQPDVIEKFLNHYLDTTLGCMKIDDTIIDQLCNDEENPCEDEISMVKVCK